MRINENYFYLCKAIKKRNEHAATHFFCEIRYAIEARPKHQYWFSLFMEKHGFYVETIFDRFFRSNK